MTGVKALLFPLHEGTEGVTTGFDSSSIMCHHIPTQAHQSYIICGNNNMISLQLTASKIRSIYVNVVYYVPSHSYSGTEVLHNMRTQQHDFLQLTASKIHPIQVYKSFY